MGYWSGCKSTFSAFIRTKQSKFQIGNFFHESYIPERLELDPGYVENRTFTVDQRDKSRPRDNFRTLGFTVGYNRSDATYGWNGYMNGLTGKKLNL